ncbi:translation initiation factor eIF3 subunit [Rhizodiscina lignyota]|uniref:Eukaryotic translation initiation factor 3 subunit J n=1 Tax=Rhizodiscina lignyota TaxID=1504668 RepID=A0A9P4M671_9PEZI|nr:translation initiation factor eIF3 subunit [Rhizodiscina lignyota]
MASWDDEEEDSTPPTSPPQIARRGKFDDEEEDSDVLESWDAADDSEAEREKAKKAAEEKAKAEAEAAKNKKTKAQRIEERRNERLKQKEEEGDDESSDEDEAEKRARERRQEIEGDLKHAEDLFGNIGISNKRATGKPVTIADPSDATNTIDLSSLAIFNPNTKDQFAKLNDTLAPLISANSKKGQYVLFLQEFTKRLCKDLPSDQVKKISSGLTTLSNEKMKEEKAAEKGGKKSKAAKTKATLAATRDISFKADTTAYDDGLEDDDFM